MAPLSQGSASFASVDEYFRTTVCQVFTTQTEDTIQNPHRLATNTIYDHTHHTRGSGFLVDAKYFEGVSSEYVIVTNFHVVARAVDIHVEFHPEGNQKAGKLQVQVLTANPQFDVAILTILPQHSDGHALPPECRAIDLGKSSDARANTELYGVGFPLGMTEIQIQRGYRTGFHIGEHDIFLQHSVPLNPGNSGGPLAILTDDPAKPFEVVGVSNAIVAGAQAIDFAITVERLLWVADVWNNSRELLQTPFLLGANFQKTDPILRKRLLHFNDNDAGTETGVLVTSVVQNSISDGVFHASDFVVAVAGMPVDDSGCVFDPTLTRAAPAIPLHIYVSRQQNLEFLDFDILRQIPEAKIHQFGAETYERIGVEAHLTLPRLEGPKEVYIPYDNIDFEIISGMILVDTTVNAAREFKRTLPTMPHVMIVNLIPQGDVMHSVQGEVAKPGTIITHVNYTPVDSIATLRQIMKKQWHPDEDTVIFTTENKEMIVLPIEHLHETNTLVMEIYGPQVSATCIPFSRKTVGAEDNHVAKAPTVAATTTESSVETNGPEGFSSQLELEAFEKEMYEKLGLSLE